MVRPVEKVQPDRRSDRLGHDRALGAIGPCRG